jgi:CubicO group peptidase (beta-lactamase class C family)
MPPTTLLPRRRLLAAAVLAAAPLPRARADAAAPGAAPAPAPPTPDPADPSTALAALLRQRLRLEGVALAAARVEGAAVHLAAAGTARAAGTAEPGAAIDPDARFEYGSVTKTFVGLLLADAVQRRELALDDAVEDALGGPRLRDRDGAPLTWLDLATHRSGLPRLPSNLQPPDPADPYAGYGAAQLDDFLRSWQPEVARGSRWLYSNLGFGLLGHALARRAGQPLPVLLRERVLAPLGLHGMALALDDADSPAPLPGHDAQRRPVPRWRFGVLAGAGALTGSARDLARYAQAVARAGQDSRPGDRPLQGAMRLALARHAAGAGPGAAMGLGWMLGALRGRPVAVHEGGTAGFSTALVLDAAAGRAALVLANAMVPVSDLAAHLLDAQVPLRDIAAERAQTQREAVVLDAAALAPLAGRYALTPAFAIEIRARGNRLSAQATGQPAFELFALDARRFFARVTPLEIEFEGAEGVPPALLLRQAGQRLRFVRE